MDLHTVREAEQDDPVASIDVLNRRPSDIGNRIGRMRPNGQDRLRGRARIHP